MCASAKTASTTAVLAAKLPATASPVKLAFSIAVRLCFAIRGEQPLSSVDDVPPPLGGAIGAVQLNSMLIRPNADSAYPSRANLPICFASE